MHTDRQVALLAEMGIEASMLRRAFAGSAAAEPAEAASVGGASRAVRSIALRVDAADARACPGLRADLERTLRRAGFDVTVTSGARATADAVVAFGAPEPQRDNETSHAGFAAPSLATLRGDAAAKRKAWTGLRRFIHDARDPR